MEPPDWFLKHAKKLRDTVQKISSISPGIANEYRAHTALKLFCVGYWSDVFTTIMKNRGIRSIFIDMFAGSGLTKVTGSDKLLPGSPIVAETYGTGYDYIICVDSNESYARVLNERLSAIREENSFIVFPNRNEEVIDEVIKITKSKKGMFFCFYDPEGYEGFSWEVLNKLGGNLRGDILITWFEMGLWRSYNASNHEMLNRVFGDESWTGCSEASDLTKRFILKLGTLRDIINPIEIMDENRTVYHELLCIKITKGGSPFLQAWESIKTYLSSEGARTTEAWLDIAYGKQMQLTDPQFK